MTKLKKLLSSVVPCHLLVDDPAAVTRAGTRVHMRRHFSSSAVGDGAVIDGDNRNAPVRRLLDGSERRLDARAADRAGGVHAEPATRAQMVVVMPAGQTRGFLILRKALATNSTLWCLVDLLG